MKLSEEKERLKYLLKDTITLLCKNGLSYKGTFSVDALIGITLGENVFLVNINETIKDPNIKDPGEKENSKEDSDSEEDNDFSDDDSVVKSARHSRKRKSEEEKYLHGTPSKKNCHDAGSESNSNYSSVNIKQEKTDFSDDLVFIKEEQDTDIEHSVLNTNSLPPISSVHSSLHGMSAWSLPTSQNYQAIGQNNPYVSGMTPTSHQETNILHTSPQTSQSQVLTNEYEGHKELKNWNSSKRTNKPGVCNVCNQMFASQINLKGHMIIKHNIGNPVTCMCGKSFPYLSNYYAHRKKCAAFLDKKSTIENYNQ